MKPLSKVWIVTEKGAIVFGDGRLHMLELIDRLGSMNKAAREMGMSYRSLWGKIHGTEKALDIKLIETQVGGGRSGGSRLTLEARSLMERFRKLQEIVTITADDEFRAVFG